MAIPFGNSRFFNEVRDEIIDLWKNPEWPVYKAIIREINSEPYYWLCPFLSAGIPIQTSQNESIMVEDIRRGHSILTLGQHLERNVKEVIFSEGSSRILQVPIVILVTYNETAIAVSPDHIFKVHDGSPGGALLTAERLTTNHHLTSPNGGPVAIRSVHIGKYASELRYFETQKAPPDPDLSQCFIVTNGVISCDYTMPLFLRDENNPLHQYFMDGFGEMPVIGSAKYIKQFGESCLDDPDHETGFIRIEKKMPEVITGSVFVAARNTFCEVPNNACRFIPCDKSVSLVDGNIRPFSDYRTFDWIDTLIKLFGNEYNGKNDIGIKYCNDLQNPDINAYAWVDKSGINHVVIRGGLINNSALETEGISMVLAHETGHHIGQHSSPICGLACEGEADFVGVKIVMPKIFYPKHEAIVRAGIAQMADFFRVSDNPNIPNDEPAGCAHPTDECRIATYHAALKGSNKPACADKIK
jgi:hypothetical protein